MQFNTQLTDEISVTDGAAAELKQITEQEDNMQGIRLYVGGGGCSGMSYGMTMVEEPTEFDAVYEKDGMKLYVDSVALSMLKGVEIDFKTDEQGPSFVFKNVNLNTGAGGGCGGCSSGGN